MHMQVITHSLRTSVLFLAMTSVVFGQNAVIQWHQDLATAQKQAAESNRLVLVHFWASWCAPCTRLEQQVFNRPVAVQAMQRGFVAVKVNADQSPALAQRYGVTGLPADVILTSSGQLLARLRCPPTADDYAAQLTQVAARWPATGQPAGRYDPRHTAVAGANPAAAGVPESVRRDAYPDAVSTAVRYGKSLGPTPPPIDNPYVGLGNSTPSGPPQVGYRANAAAAGPRYQPTTAAGSPQASGQAAVGDPAPPRSSTSVPAATLRSATPVWSQGQTASTVPSQADDRYSAAAPPPAERAASGMTTAPGVAAPRYREAWQPAGTGAVAAPVEPARQWRASPSVRGAATTQRPSSTVADHATAGSPQAGPHPLGMEGYCPVTLKEKQRWVPGDRRWGVNHRGRTYLFASAEAQRRFLADPEAFSPVLSGIDPVLAIDQGRSVSGQRRHGVFFDGQVYLFSSEVSLQRFTQSPKRYATGIRQAMQSAANRIGPR